jgi:N6-adenosine-specific RNA methylase IME4
LARSGEEGLLTKQYSIIYADPPWSYPNGGNGRAKKHYPLMPTADICALPVNTLAARDCALFLWATFPLLPEAFRAIGAWGFLYKCAAFVWVKPNRHSPGWASGTGFWTRANAEVCLLATTGRPQRKANNVRQLIIEPRREHSRKPDEARERILRLFGDLPRVELFARRPAPGWDVWGNEVNSTLSGFGPTWPEVKP